MILDRCANVKEHVTFSIRVRPELKAQLEEIAYQNRRPLGKTVELILNAAISEDEMIAALMAAKQDTA